VIRSFRDRGTADVFDGRDTKAARRACPPASGTSLGGQDAIRINDQYRICYTWTAEGPASVEITDYH